MTQESDDLVQRDAACFLHQTGSSPVEHAIIAAEGCRLQIADGRWIYDLHGNGCHHLGYGHPRLIAAATRQMETLPFAPRRFTNRTAVSLAERLTARWPGGDGRVLLAPSGNDAIEIALKLARLATDRAGTLAFEGAWHGAGLGALSVGGRADERPARLGPLLADCHHVPGYDAWTPDWEASARYSLDAVEKKLAAKPSIGCLIAEPVTAGPTMPPPWYWLAIREACDRQGVLLIVDEVPRGLGRTGRFFASEHGGVRPDMTVIGKSLGGALVPLAAVIAHADLNVAADLAIGHYTHEKSALGSAIALEVLDVIEDDRLVDRAMDIGQRLVVGLRSIDGIRNASAIGGQIAIAFDDEARTPGIVRTLFEMGVNITAASGRATLMPPLIMTDDEVDDVAGRFGDALASLS